MPQKTFGCPKPKRKKRIRHHKASILDKADGTCYLCRHLYEIWQTCRCIEEHHIFFGTGQRWKSEEDGLKVHLCVAHHRIGPEAVHVNALTCRMLQEIAQAEYEKTHSRQEFIERYGKNYLGR